MIVVKINKNRFSDQVALVTGGAGFIGSCTAKRLASEGCTVVICDINQEKAQIVAEHIITDGGRAVSISADIRNSAEVRRVVSEVFEEFGKVDLLVSVAGGSTREKMCYFCDQSEDVILDNITMNFFGALHFAHAISKHMADRRCGKMIFVTSVVGTQGGRGHAEYSAAKGGLITFVKTLAQEMGEFGVTVNCVSPGLVERGDGDASAANFLGRNCTADDISNAITFLASSEADFITGLNCMVDGGWGLGTQSNIKPGRYDFGCYRNGEEKG